VVRRRDASKLAPEAAVEYLVATVRAGGNWEGDSPACSPASSQNGRCARASSRRGEGAGEGEGDG
jgi:hypothetical protein